MTTPTPTAEPFTAQAFAAFWADPKPEYVVADAFLPRRRRLLARHRRCTASRTTPAGSRTC